MARKKKSLQHRDRFAYASGKLFRMLRWVVVSGVATYFLSELKRYVDGAAFDEQVMLLMNVFINTLLFSAAKYKEGSD